MTSLIVMYKGNDPLGLSIRAYDNDIRGLTTGLPKPEGNARFARYHRRLLSIS